MVRLLGLPLRLTDAAQFDEYVLSEFQCIVLLKFQKIWLKASGYTASPA